VASVPFGATDGATTPRPLTSPARLLRVRAVALVLVLALVGATANIAPVGAVPPRGAPHSFLFAVGQRHETFVDHTRPTSAFGGRPAKPDRTLVVNILYPAAGAPSTAATITPDAAPASGRFPLVVFSPGYTANGDTYNFLLQRWVQAGYVVAAITFPLSSFPGGDAADYVNQPGDVSFVLTQVLKLDGERSTPFYQLINAREVAAAGHSLGAITTLGVAYNSCCIDPRLDAAVPMSGIEAPFPNGSFTNPPPTPMLLIHGGADTTVPVFGSENAYSNALPPKVFVLIPAAGHVQVLFGPGGDDTTTAVLDFLDGVLRHHHRSVVDLKSDVEAGGTATVAEQLK
jgi:alpha-beta hydrolase superfamily lysophospholipase